MAWEEEKEYYNSIGFEELLEEIEFLQHSNPKHLDTESNNSQTMVDLIMRAFERREDKHSRGSS